jgi:hypothetical protein
MNKIKETHPALHGHLNDHIETGYSCRYTPPSSDSPDWIFD